MGGHFCKTITWFIWENNNKFDETTLFLCLRLISKIYNFSKFFDKIYELFKVFSRFTKFSFIVFTVEQKPSNQQLCCQKVYLSTISWLIICLASINNHNVIVQQSCFVYTLFKLIVVISASFKYWVLLGLMNVWEHYFENGYELWRFTNAMNN